MHALTMRRGAAYIRFTVDSADPSYKAEWENGATSWSVRSKGWRGGWGGFDVVKCGSEEENLGD